MNRRDFIKDAALAGLFIKIGPAFLDAGQAKTPDMAVIKGESPALITKAAVDALGGMKKFIARGDRVVIKPNIGWDRTPEMAACTNPDVVRTLSEMCLNAGAKEVIVMDNTTNQAKRCYIRSGIQEAAKQGGATVLFAEERRLKKVPLNGQWLKEWDVFQEFLDADKIINVPIAKVHSLCRLTLSMKNWLGALGGARNQLHQKLDDAVVDLQAFFKPTLTVLDAYRILVRNGPQGGRPSDTELIKTIVAGIDPVAVDAMGATFFNIKAPELPYLRIAQDRGLGRSDLAKLVIDQRTV
jgi:uncharacterized protein (DUF362 family)